MRLLKRYWWTNLRYRLFYRDGNPIRPIYVYQRAVGRIYGAPAWYFCRWFQRFRETTWAGRVELVKHLLGIHYQFRPKQKVTPEMLASLPPAKRRPMRELDENRTSQALRAAMEKAWREKAS